MWFSLKNFNENSIFYTYDLREITFDIKKCDISLSLIKSLSLLKLIYLTLSMSTLLIKCIAMCATIDDLPFYIN